MLTNFIFKFIFFKKIFSSKKCDSEEFVFLLRGVTNLKIFYCFVSCFRALWSFFKKIYIFGPFLFIFIFRGVAGWVERKLMNQNIYSREIVFKTRDIKIILFWCPNFKGKSLDRIHIFLFFFMDDLPNINTMKIIKQVQQLSSFKLVFN